MAVDWTVGAAAAMLDAVRLWDCATDAAPIVGAAVAMLVAAKAVADAMT